MRVRHTIAAGLAGILLIQSVALAQRAPGPQNRTISHERGVEILLSNLEVGAELQIVLANGDRVEGRLAEKSDQELIVVTNGQRLIVSTADIVEVRAPTRGGMTSGKAFGIGTGIGWERRPAGSSSPNASSFGGLGAVVGFFGGLALLAISLRGMR